MKKVMIGFALVCFVAFGTLCIQNAVASTDNVEIVNLNLDDDADKEKMIAMSEKVYESWSKKMGQEYVNKVRTALKD